MSSNSFGEVFRVTTYGESHGRGVGVVVEGCPSGLELSEGDIQRELDRRRPGQGEVTTARREADRVNILSGVFEGRTVGTPIGMLVYNEDVDSSPYVELRNKPRPNHADFTYHAKYGHFDWRGGGRASGRETLARVAAGAIAKKLLASIEVEVLGHSKEIAGIRVGTVTPDDIRSFGEKNPVRCADPKAAKRMEEAIVSAKKTGDSVGGIVELVALNVPPGLGEPVFDKLDADIAKALMSIGAVKGVEIGAGFQVAGRKGSENNDAFYVDDGVVRTKTNNSGGVLGGISSGMPIVVRAAVKPTSSIAKEQDTVDLATMENTKITVKGRHDPCIVPRVLPVCESMLALVLADHAIRGGFIPTTKLQ
ncbi:MAG: chorismate synthase [Candidatus Hydrothermarchaeaceae archaeon]